MKNRTTKTNYEGILRACEAALKTDDKKLDLTSLWKYSSDESDIPLTIQFAKSAIENHFKGVKVRIETTPRNEIFGYLSGELQASRVESWIKKHITKRHHDIAFHQLQSFYKQEPRWLTKNKGFLGYLKTILRKICEELGNVFTFDINKHKQKILVQYVA